MTLRSEDRESASGSLPTAAERAYTELRQRILDGRLPAGPGSRKLNWPENLASAGPPFAMR